MGPTPDNPPPDKRTFVGIHDACEQFELLLQQGQSPKLENYLGQVGVDSRKRLFQELLMVECEFFQEQGQPPSYRLYRRRFPDYKSLVKLVFEQLDLLDLPGSSSAILRPPSAASPAPSALPTDLTQYDLPPQKPGAKPDDPTRLSGTPLVNPSVNISDFSASIIQWGIISADDMQQLLNSLPPQEQTPEIVVKHLVRNDNITPFQAQELLGRRGNRLVLGPYRLLDVLGEGGMGAVYKAYDTVNRRLVAVKILTYSPTHNQELILRFQREIKAAKRLRHPNIVSIEDSGEFEGTYYLVMEYLPGIDLDRLVKRKGPLTPSQAIHFIQQAAAGLDYAHRSGVIHRDIKPANLILSQDGLLKILDLGLAVVEHGESSLYNQHERLTQTGQILGTTSYMAPEQAMNIKEVDQRVDIYSLGCTLYFLLNGRPPYKGDTDLATLCDHQDKPIPPLSLTNPVPPWLDLVFRRMLAKQKEHRYSSMEALLQDINQQGLSASQSTLHGPPVPVAYPVPQQFNPFQDQDQVQDEEEDDENSYVFIIGVGLSIGLGALILLTVLVTLSDYFSAS